MFHYVECITKELDGGGNVAGLFFDLSLGFDTVNVSFIADKLFQMGVPGNLLDGLQYFMWHRKLNVTIDVHLEVAQGFVLRPLLFLIFVNDISLYVKPDLLIDFADDTVVVLSAGSPEHLQIKIERVTGQIVKWCRHNNLLSTSKIVELKFHRYNRQCELYTMFLGFNLDGSINWNFCQPRLQKTKQHIM